MTGNNESWLAQHGELVAGAWDTHVHVAPGLFPRWGDAWDLIQACKVAHMRGVVLKAHHGSTVEVAVRLAQEQSQICVHGGVTLNGFVGGLNPLAVELCLQLGGRMVWLPTVHARNHGRVFGVLGGFSREGPAPRFLHSNTLTPEQALGESMHCCMPPDGLSVLNGKGELVGVVKDILHLLHQQEVVLGTGHLSVDEIFAIRHYIAEQKIVLRLLVNHALFVVPSLSAAQINQLAAPWVFFETCYYTISPVAHLPRSPTSVARCLADTEQVNWILASDSGQADNLICPEALACFSAALLAEAVKPALVARMLRQTPEELFGP